MGHNHTAYAREDVEDAKRGAPAVSLESWAGERGLTFLGSALAGAFATVLPLWPDYLFNVCRGEVAPGRLGQLAHELDELPATNGKIDAGGTFYGTRLTTRHGLRSFIGLERERPNEPFAANAVWVPTTAVSVRVPEVTLLPRVRIRMSGWLDRGGRDLAHVGLPGFRITDSGWIDDAVAETVGAAAGPLGQIDAQYVSLTIDHGVFSMVRNGFVSDPAVLDHLMATAAAIAEGLAAATLPLPESLPWCDPQPHEAEAFDRAADETGMTRVDPLDFHRSHRRLPFPGRAHGLLHGTVPGTDAQGHLAFTDQAAHTGGTYRTVVLLPAAPGASTPVGGTVHAPTDQYVEVVDGLAVSWPRTRSVGRLDVVERTDAGVRALRESGLIAG